MLMIQNTRHPRAIQSLRLALQRQRLCKSVLSQIPTPRKSARRGAVFQDWRFDINYCSNTVSARATQHFAYPITLYTAQIRLHPFNHQYLLLNCRVHLRGSRSVFLGMTVIWCVLRLDLGPISVNLVHR